MDIIRFAIENPVKVAVGVLLTLLFGLLAVVTIPIQLTPNVDKPVLTVETRWTGRSPEEVETEIIQEQEDKLKSLTNLRKMTATANQGTGKIELEFYVGTEMNRARQEVSDKLREVPSYPDDVDEPVISSGETEGSKAIAWLIITSDEPGFDVEGLGDQIEDRVKPYLETVEGVTQVNVYGGRDRQVHIQIDPRELAQRGVTFNTLVGAIRDTNVNVSAGELPEGRLDIRVRTVGQYDNVEDVLNTVVMDTDSGPVRVRDLGDVVETLEKRRAFVRSKGEPGLALPVFREAGSNVMSVMAEVRKRIEVVNRDILPTLGPKLKMVQVYDETNYISQAIALVVNNLWIGGALAGLVLLLFLRTLRPTVVVAMSIPISIIGTFVVMTAFGRNLNVISLAGLAFAVGMVVDAAIVVLENIDRHLSMGKPVRTAAYVAAKEVWGAILASTLTTVAVFVPVIFMEEEAGQLFRDIAIAICAAVTLSLIVSVTVIPSASARFLKAHDDEPDVGSLRGRARRLFGLTKVLAGVTNWYAELIYRMTAPTGGRVAQRVGVVGLMTVLSLGGAWLLMPPTSYLPAGNKNLVFGFMLTPPGYNLEQNGKIGEHMEARLKPYWEAKTQAELAGLAKKGELPAVVNPFSHQPVLDIPPIENFFFVSFGTVFYGAMSADDQNVKPLSGLLQWAGSGVPASTGLAFQQGLFGHDMLGGNSIDIEVVGEDLDLIRQDAIALRDAFKERYRVSPSPGNFDKPSRETQIRVDFVKASALGIQAGALGMAVQGLVDGVTIGDYRLYGDNVDLVLVRHPDLPLEPDTLKMVPIAYYDRDGKAGIVPLSHVADVVEAQSPQQILRIDYQRAVMLSMSAPPGVPLEQMTAEVQATIDRMKQAGELSDQGSVTLSGTADKLTQVRSALLGRWQGWNGKSFYSILTSRMFLALLVTFLLMAALFESFLYPMVIMFSVPLATIGGFVGLAIVRASDPSQQLDTLTMLGFVILIGIVVNNAILIVHQALNFMRGVGEGEGDTASAMPVREAIRESVRSRIRPIFMTTATSVCGMLPLILMPGSGSELYKGLGSVVVGGLVVSTLFTLIVVPLLFSLVLDARHYYFRLRGKALPDSGQVF